MVEVTVELPEEIAAQLTRRAAARGTSANEVVADAIRAALAQDPLGFVGSFESTVVTGASAQDYLESENFGR